MQDHKFTLDQIEYSLKRGLPDDLIRHFLYWVLPDSSTHPKGKAAQIRALKKIATDGERPTLQRIQQSSTVVDNIARFIIGVLGGGALLGPMIIMTFHKSQTARLITVSVAVLIFGFLLSVSTKAANQEILGATAAYAAVMVVYIGSVGT